MHTRVKEIARARGISIVDVIREALEVYEIGIAYAHNGKRLMWIDDQAGERTEVLIPGFTGSVSRSVPVEARKERADPRRQKKR